ncbi:cupin domain-containing protein (plasmid) [Citricoccus nitrophenolicus]
MPNQTPENQSVAHVIPWNRLEPYTPPRHTGTVNHRLLEGSVTEDEFNIVHGAIEYGGEAEAHYHSRSVQFLHLLSGSCRVTLDDSTEELAAGDSVYIPIGVRHRVEVTSPEGITLINVYQPALAADDILA